MRRHAAALISALAIASGADAADKITQIASDPPTMMIGQVELQAVHSGRSMTVGWRELTDSSRWHQGWD
jgi:hypothetical protein